MTIRLTKMILLCLMGLTGDLLMAKDTDVTAVPDAYSNTLEIYPKNVYWGDTHLHTNLSWDAYDFGNRNIGPDEAYRFAKGEVIQAHNGIKVKLDRPLDFLVVADHASNLGVLPSLASGNDSLLSSDLGRQVASELEEIENVSKVDASKGKVLALNLFAKGFLDGAISTEGFNQALWLKIAKIADKHYVPGQFTTFSGFEWTQWFYNLHRVVIFKDDYEKVTQVLPFSQYDSNDPERLWDYMQGYEDLTHGEVLAIPHNGNFSWGVMFALENISGYPLSKNYAKKRSRWEPLFEVTQIKGDSEAHPLLSPLDEFADYETVSSKRPTTGALSEKLKKRMGFSYYDSWVKKNNDSSNKSWMHRYEYARPALKLGLSEQKRLGTNPFKFGLIGGTDAHTSLAAVDEDNFWGKFTWVEPYAGRLSDSIFGADFAIEKKAGEWSETAWKMNAAGYAAIWAEENTRESLFAAMKRKEVYASTGPRITVRFFGGWDYEENDAYRPDLARIGYMKGVPMGGDLTAAPQDAAPTFLIRAVKDPEGANLDRIQVIKGWQDASGELHEKIYNVAVSDNRKENNHGKVKPVGNTVDIPDASYTNTIGDPELAIVWQDPDFDKEELAFYYLRVLEIPTPRWTAYDAKYFKVTDLPKEIPMITQERAYTSPIWYTPNSLRH